MNDQMTVRVRHSRANFAEWLQSFRNGKTVLVAICVERNPLDVFHDKVRQTAIGRSAIEETGYIWMIKARQNLPFGPEMAQHRVRVHAAFNELNRDLLFVFGVGALCQINRAHSATPDFANDAIMVDHLACDVTALFQDFAGKEKIGVIEESAGTMVRLEKRLDLSLQLFVSSASCL